jgi:hypothetical protein
MPIKCDRDGFIEEKSLYAPLIEYRVMILALDHFFREVVEGNLPLSGTDNQWEQGIVPERVTRYSKNWCVLYETLAHLRERVEEQGIYADQVTVDANLDFAFKSNRREHDPAPIEWTEKEGF